MTTLEAINKAKNDGHYFWDPAIDCDAACDNSIFLDPLFWQALGKSLGWEEQHNCDAAGCSSIECKEEWRYHQHRFIDALADGGNPASFFKDL